MEGRAAALLARERHVLPADCNVEGGLHGNHDLDGSMSTGVSTQRSLATRLGDGHLKRQT